ncbi:MAG: AAA family ATPase, partial [Treponema sp.]|nr:AAA family ATPase [Candidatus Treponema equifaecale]
MFINTLGIKKKQQEIGMPVNDSTRVLVFRGETGTGKSIMAEHFINQLKKSKCLCSQNVELTTVHKFQRLYKYDVDISKFLSEKNLGVFCIDEIHNDERYLHELLLGITEKKFPTICILLGIKKPLEKFFKEKPELADLVSFYDFPNVSESNLALILEKKLIQCGFVFDDDVKDLFLPCVQETKNNSNTIYRNGWIVEKEILWRISENQAARLSKSSTLSKNDLKKILVSDLPVSKKAQSVDEVLSQLDELIGMNSVKAAVRELCNTIVNNQKRKELGITVENPKIHIVLTGNPGTGKTTVSRILGKLFFAMKLLPSDKVVEVDGLGLTAGYVGQTKDKVNELCDKAMGGVLFIDEAYYLAGSEGGANSYGNEAVGALLKRMEDDRGKSIIIAAGYQNEVQNFLKMNPGLD